MDAQEKPSPLLNEFMNTRAGLVIQRFIPPEKLVHHINLRCLKNPGYFLMIRTAAFNDARCLVFSFIFHPYGGFKSAYTGKHFDLSHHFLPYLYSLLDDGNNTSPAGIVAN